MKKLWKQNRVVFVLVIILIICFIAIVSVALTFFYSTEVDRYGLRLEGIEKYPITNEFKASYKESLLEDESVKNVTFNVVGRIIYIHIDYDEKIILEDAKTIVTNSLELFEEDIIGYYDIEFVLKSDNFTTIGAKNSIVDHITWNNNKEIEVEEENEEQ